MFGSESIATWRQVADFSPTPSQQRDVLPVHPYPMSRISFDSGYPQSLLAVLWITCSSIAASHTEQALHAFVQKTISLSCGFYGLFQEDKGVGSPIFAPNLCWRFCG